ncbi:hypothetical protein PFISCL1PPCAC_17125, partial [Pristionchus fissidentatus]
GGFNTRLVLERNHGANSPSLLLQLLIAVHECGEEPQRAKYSGDADNDNVDSDNVEDLVFGNSRLVEPYIIADTTPATFSKPRIVINKSNERYEKEHAGEENSKG